MVEPIERTAIPDIVDPPDYKTLLSWWDAWPETRTAHLDFWARGNFARRLISRSRANRAACIVRAEYLDEMEAALKRLALLDIDVDFAWIGEMSPPQFVIVPQDVSYEDTGGWGYSACAGDSFKDCRGDREWCPSMGWAVLLPDTITDWLYEQASGFFRDGKLMVAPVSHMGLRKLPGGDAENMMQRMSNGLSLMGEQAKIESIFSIELPFIDGMSVQDAYKFQQDHKDSLTLYQGALRKIVQNSSYDSAEQLTRELVTQINEGVAELRLSDRTLGARKLLTSLGATLGTFLVTFGIRLGVDPGVAAIGSVAAAIGSLTQMSQILESRGQMRRNPFYAIWNLQKGKGPKNQFRQPPSFGYPFPPNRKKKTDPSFHWLYPPTPGWYVPTAYIRGPE